MSRAVLAACVAAVACGDTGAQPDAAPEFALVAVTFNTGTGPDLPHDGPPDDGYTSADAAVTDQYYGNGLAWTAFVDDTARFFAQVRPDVVAFQEIFYSGDCAAVPPDKRTGYVCETWAEGDPTVAQLVLGAGYQVACHVGKPDKCIGVRRAFGTIRGCDADLCVDGLDGAPVAGCGSGSRVGRAVVDLAAGGSLTVVNIHGTSGLAPEDTACRVAQFDQVFVDLDGAPAANGAVNLVLGDLNIDPGRFAGQEASATRFAEFAGDGKPFHFLTDVGPDATPTYQGALNIDHVVSDRLAGSCWAAGVTDGHPPVHEAVFFDHVPIVCTAFGAAP
ncbi:MAG: endonuclease/exonuclease/phosphatase family protein [Deltaproteobacteria bacterium]|nr:MAG: endonuclease/exonuclease/phosphatase family protein [Deltaproteobacteria bacterium]